MGCRSFSTASLFTFMHAGTEFRQADLKAKPLN